MAIGPDAAWGAGQAQVHGCHCKRAPLLNPALPCGFEEGNRGLCWLLCMGCSQSVFIPIPCKGAPLSPAPAMHTLCTQLCLRSSRCDGLGKLGGSDRLSFFACSSAGACGRCSPEMEV